MKRSILCVIVLVSLSPALCLAEFETNAIFTLGGTLWSQSSAEEDVGFHENKVYICYGTACAEMPEAVYLDFIFCSLFVVETAGLKIGSLTKQQIHIHLARVDIV